ncbi:polyprenyl synthetase family protein [Phaeobacter sp.]|uniref:polyprenyl synthetase family protein n=1 Tax=Phaeobacter sp. TaxID=1902409 RepID=UPI0025D16E60|nr:polyprenyl synthetase family protein [Phaeobacter sp.]
MKDRLQQRIDTALARATRSPAPQQLAEALTYAVNPGGARIRPTVLMQVASACGDPDPQASEAAAAALELIHCASLVHDDLPCFDDADLRRGKPSLHRAYSQPIAVLAGDSLILAAFETLSDITDTRKAIALVRHLARYTGMPNGICAGQGWESEETVDLSAYHQAKTGALFIAATEMGAIAADQDPAPWQDLGAMIGEAFQVADDLRDALYDEQTLGKPAGQDVIHDRPNAVNQFGVGGAIEILQDILAGAIASIPACPGEAALAQLVRKTAEKLTPVTGDSQRVPGE